MEDNKPPKEPLSRRHRAHITSHLCYRRNIPKVDREGLPILDTRDGAPPWDEIVPQDKPIELEIGPGKGRFIVNAAEGRPDVFFVGVEAAAAYAYFTADRARKADLNNFMMIHDDARIFLEETIPTGALAALHIYFPDPWPKRRHRKRRFFRPGTLEILHRTLDPKGHLIIATDNIAYFGEMLALLGPSPLFARLPELEADDCLPPEKAFGPTNFEIKYRLEGRTINRAAWRPLPCKAEAEG